MNSARRLVVCDDEKDFCFYVRQVAEGQGYEVREIVNSGECCEVIAAFAPDVVVLDIVMPAPDGIEIVQRLARTGFAGRVLLTSGYNPDYTRMASVLAAAKGLKIHTLAKPLPLERLQSALR